MSDHDPAPSSDFPHPSPHPSPHPAAAVPSSAEPADIGHQLRQLFPALFTGAPKPLKLRIQLDIQERAPGRFSKQALSAFFRRHTGSTSYLIAVSKAADRFDLEGRPSGELSAEHRQLALDELARRRSSREERFALEDQQRRNRASLLFDHDRTTLTKANFCALKAVAVDELDGLLEIARREAVERREAATAHDRSNAPRGHPAARRDRPAHRDAPGRPQRGPRL